MYILLLLVSALAGFAAAAKTPGSSFGIRGQNATFDYVIIGGGTAGLTVAARLAEDPSISVAVVEAGGFYEVDNGNRSVIPGMAFVGISTDPTQTPLSLIDWGFVTTPQAGADGRKLYYTRGKTLGGSSARNYMGYHRPSVGSFQKWATAVGDDSFTFDRILPYYKKSVTFTPPNYSKRFTNTTLNYDPNAFDNSSRGPLQVSYPNWAAPFETWVQIGLDAIGIKRNYGFNSGNLFGSMWLTTTIDPSDETRSSSQTSFLDQATQTSGLQVYTQTLAKRILFNSNKTANGVLVTTMGQPYTLSARKEVILSAGVFQSPQLLMVSGIGPRSTLQYHDIPLLSELPGVGQNMWDHIIFGSSFRVNLLTDSELSISHEYAAQVTQLYLQNQSGPLTYPAGYVGYEKLPNRQDFSITANESLAKLPNDWPEIGYIPVDTYTGYNDRPATAILNDGNNYGTIVNVLVAPQSRGNVTIASPDTSDPPIINPNWLTDPTDAEVVVAAFKRTRQVWNHLEEITIGPEKLPGPTVQTDEEILAYIRQDFSQLYHAAATCAMGQEGESGAVVDSRGRVFGVKGLRVVDASAFPFLPPGLPQSTVYMLAEKISDDIKTGR